MGVDVTKLVAAISPDYFCTSSSKSKVKKAIKEGLEKKDPLTYIKAAKLAEVKAQDFMDVFDIGDKGSVFKLPGLKNPIEKHLLITDNFSGALEPIYFWILDYVNGVYGETIKLVDNFVSSTGSGHFSEQLGKATKMQEEAMKMLGAANQVVKSILNIIYDLKEFKLRLDIYKDLKSKDKFKRQSAILSLKQIWMDQVDVKRGNNSIKGLAMQGANNPNFAALIDAFMAAESLEQVSKSESQGGLDLNDRVRRLLQQRYGEFERWLDDSEKELRKRYEIEKSYLKSQYNNVKLYARWAKPYLNAARQLEQRATPNSSIINAFNTSVMELIVLAKGRYNADDDVYKGDLPEMFRKESFKKKLRGYFPITIMEFRFRSSPERSAPSQGYGFRGRLEMVFTSFALNKDEIDLLVKEVEKDDVGDLLKAIEGTTEESLGQINDDIEFFIENKDEQEEKENKSEDSNPFGALFSSIIPEKKSEKKKDEKKDSIIKIKPDNEYEKVLRSQAAIEARKACRKLYDTYKKVHGMSAFPDA